MRSFGLVTWLSSLFVLVQVAEAAPAQWGMAVNATTKECAGYWAGDEFTRYDLPTGWIAYYPSQHDSGMAIGCKTDAGVAGSKLVTPLGSCCFQSSEEDCCKQMGVKFVSSNIGAKREIPRLDSRAEAGARADGGTGGDGSGGCAFGEHASGGVLLPCFAGLLLVLGAGLRARVPRPRPTHREEDPSRWCSR